MDLARPRWNVNEVFTVAGSVVATLLALGALYFGLKRSKQLGTERADDEYEGTLRKLVDVLQQQVAALERKVRSLEEDALRSERVIAGLRADNEALHAAVNEANGKIARLTP